MVHSNWLYLIAETIADARNGAKEPTVRRWRSPFSKRSVMRDLVGLPNPYDSLEQRGVRALLHKLFKRN